MRSTFASHKPTARLIFQIVILSLTLNEVQITPKKGGNVFAKLNVYLWLSSQEVWGMNMNSTKTHSTSCTAAIPWAHVSWANATLKPSSKVKQTPDVGAVRQSGQNDNNSPSETISNWTGSAPLPLHQIFTPLLVKEKIKVLSLTDSVVWMKCDYLFRMLSCTVRGANDECCNKCWRRNLHGKPQVSTLQAGNGTQTLEQSRFIPTWVLLLRLCESFLSVMITWFSWK